MEMYTWSEDSIKVILTNQELNNHGIDFTEEILTTGKAEAFFTSLFWMIARHFSLDPTTQLDVEIFQRTVDTISMIVHFLEEDGSRSTLPRVKQHHNEQLFRFSLKEDLFAFAKRTAPYGVTGGTIYHWKPFYYLYVEGYPFYQEKWLALLEEYGERAHVDIDIVRVQGEMIVSQQALQKILQQEI